MASYLFDSDGLVKFSRYVTPDSLFAFDLDGTLAPIVNNYLAAKVTEPFKTTLERLHNYVKVAVITGRSRKDALAILGFEPHLLIGNHGAEWPIQEVGRNWNHVQLCLKWQESLYGVLSYIKGIEFEFKGESISLHYRKTDDPEQALTHINTAIEDLDPLPQRIDGKFVVNLLPVDALTKGGALVAAMEMFGSKRAIFIGDDETDEDVFRLKNVDVFGIHIGQDGQTAAPYYLKKQAALLGLLNSMAGMLENYVEAGRDNPTLP